MADKTVRVLLQAVTGPYERDMRRAAGTTQTFGARHAASVRWSRERVPNARRKRDPSSSVNVLDALLATRALRHERAGLSRCLH